MTKHQVTIEIGGFEFDCEVHVSPLIRGVHTLSNGDPGFPDEGGETEIVSAIYSANPSLKIDFVDLIAELNSDRLEELVNDELEAKGAFDGPDDPYEDQGQYDGEF